MNAPLHLKDLAEVAEKGKTLPAEADAEVARRKADTTEAEEAFNVERTKTQALKQSRALARTWVRTESAALTAARNAAAQRGITNYAETNHDSVADDFARQAEHLAWRIAVIKHCDEVILPAQISEQSRSEAWRFRCLGSLAAAECVQSSVRRLAALGPLVATEGTISLGATGRTVELFHSSLEYHRRASEIEATVHAKEELRLARIEEMK